MNDLFKDLSPEEIIFYIDSALESYKYDDLINLKYYIPTEKMKIYYRAGLEARERMILGGVRTGKTYGALIERYYHATGLYANDWEGYRFSRPINTLLASVSYQMTRDVLQGTLFKGSIDGSVPPIIHPDLIVDRTHTNIAGAYGSVGLKNVYGGVSYLYFRAYSQGASALQGVKYDDVMLDESVKFDVYQEALMRTASFSGERTLLTVTQWPEKGMDETTCHFLNKTEDDGTEGHIEPETVYKNKFYMHIGWDDNPYLPEEEKKRLEESTPVWQLEARKNGVPVFGHGKVFIQPEHEYIKPPFDLLATQYSHFAHIYGLDPSVTSGGTYGYISLTYDRDADVVYVRNDYKLSNVTPSEHASNISRLIAFQNCPGKVDPAGAGENQHSKESTIDYLIKVSGLNLSKAIKVNGTKEAMIDEIYERIRSGRFFILYDPHTNSGCVNLIKEIRQYSRDKKGQIIKKNDHCIDALLYALNGIGLSVSKNYMAYHKSSNHPSRV
jgi:phage terminase large subunit-like protein